MVSITQNTFIPTIEVLKVIIERLEGLQNGN